MSQEKEFDVVGLLPSLRAFANALERDRDQSRLLVERTLRRAVLELHTYPIGTDVRRWLFRLMLDIKEVRASHGKSVLALSPGEARRRHWDA